MTFELFILILSSITLIFGTISGNWHFDLSSILFGAGILQLLPLQMKFSNKFSVLYALTTVMGCAVTSWVING